MKMALKARSIIEIVGGPKEYVDKAMGIVVEKLKEDKKAKLVKEKIFEAKEMQDKRLFSSFCEVEIEVKEVGDLFGFCFDFMPSSIEIHDPTSVNLRNEDLNDMFNELLAKMHQYDMAVKNLYAQNILLRRKYGEPETPKKK